MNSLFDAEERPSFADRLRARGEHPDQLRAAGYAEEYAAHNQKFIDRYDGGKRKRTRRGPDEIALARRAKQAERAAEIGGAR